MKPSEKKAGEPLEKHKRPEAKDEVKLNRRHLRRFLLLFLISLGEVSGLLLFVALLVSGSLVVVGLALGVAQRLPLVTKLLADLTYGTVRHSRSSAKAITLTEADTGVLLANLVTVVVGEEHVGRETTLGGVGVWSNLALAGNKGHSISAYPSCGAGRASQEPCGWMRP